MGENGKQWFVVHTYSGYEERVKKNLEQRIKFMDSPDIYEIVIPTEEETEVKNGQRRTITKKILPGYVLVQMAMNDQTAEIITGSRLGYKVKTVTTTGMVESVEFLDVGTKLVITPSIKSDGLIIMEIHPEISEGAIVGDLPQKNSTETTTKLIIKDGQTIVIGGLIRDTSKKEVKGVPLLMDIPVIGAFFKRTDITSEKKEVIVLITPHIMNSRSLDQMEAKINATEKQRQDITPAMSLDLVR